MDAAERALLVETVSAALAGLVFDDTVFDDTVFDDTVLDGRPRDGTASSADAALAEIGWLEMLDAEPRDAIGIVFNALGAANATATVLDDVVVSALGSEPARTSPSCCRSSVPGTRPVTSTVTSRTRSGSRRLVP